jgi:hypothetical protein
VLDLDYLEDSAPMPTPTSCCSKAARSPRSRRPPKARCYDEEGLLRLLRLARIGCDRIFARRRRPSGSEPQARLGKLVIATHNAGKLKEIAALLAPYGSSASRRARSAARAG